MKIDIKNIKNIIIICILAIPIGFIVGILDTIFGKTLLKITDIREKYALFLIPFLSISGVFIVFIYNKFGKNTSKGMHLIFLCAQNKERKIPLRLIPFVIFSTWLTHLFGGSAGREGVAVQIGGTFSSYIDEKLNLKNTKKIFLITGMSAGFAGLFQTPIAAIFFAIEVLIAGNIHFSALAPAIISSFVACFTSSFLGLEKFTFSLSQNLNLNLINISKLIVLGIIFGLIGSLFALCLKYFKSYFNKLFKNPIKKIFIVSIILSIIFLVLYNGRYSGLGTNLINASFYKEDIYIYDWFLKLILTSLTLSIGFQGGEVTPLFSIGASFGVVLSSLFNLPLELVASLGYISVFGSATNTFFAPIFIGGEVFGYEYIPIYFICMSFAYLFNFNKSIYDLQEISK